MVSLLEQGSAKADMPSLIEIQSGININQSEASIYSLLRKVSDFSNNLNFV